MAVPLIALILEGDFIRHAGSGQDVTGNFSKPSPLNKFLGPIIRMFRLLTPRYRVNRSTWAVKQGAR